MTTEIAKITQGSIDRLTQARSETKQGRYLFAFVAVSIAFGIGMDAALGRLTGEEAGKLLQSITNALTQAQS